MRVYTIRAGYIFLKISEPISHRGYIIGDKFIADSTNFA